MKLAKYIAAGALILSFLVLTGCGSTKPAANEVSQDKTKNILKVGSDIAYAPFEYRDGKTNQDTGFDLELVKAVGEAAGFDVKIENTAWDGLVPALNVGKIDLIISAMTITEERSKSILFGDKYFLATQYIAVKEGSSIKSSEDLKGKKVGVQNATTGMDVAEKIGVKNIKKYDTTPDALNALKIGAVDAVVADSPVVLAFIAENQDAKITYITGDFDKEYYGMAVKLENRDLIVKINDGLNKVKASGKYNELYKKYFNTDAPQF